VDDGEPPVAVDVRVRVGVGRRTVGGPAGVPHGRIAGRQRVLGQRTLQVGKLAGTLAHPDPATVGHRDPGGVVPPILEPAKPSDDNIDGPTRTSA
jgi:hypothetical protein